MVAGSSGSVRTVKHKAEILHLFWASRRVEGTWRASGDENRSLKIATGFETLTNIFFFFFFFCC